MPRSPNCLFTEQTLAYQIIYILHYIGLAWNFAHWIMDGFHLWPEAQTKTPKPLPWPLAVPGPGRSSLRVHSR